MDNLDINLNDNNNSHQINFRKPSLAQASLIYSICVILFLVVGPRIQKISFNIGVLTTEYIIILLPPLIFLSKSKFNIKKVLRLNKVSLLNLFLTFWVMILAIPIVGIVNVIYLFIIKHIFGKLHLPDIPIASDSKGVIINILIIAVSAGVCEEVLFRGVILRGFEKFGQTKAIILTATLFGLMHMDFQKLAGTILLGILIGFIVYRTNSIFSGMFAHFVNNGFAVVMAFFLNKFDKTLYDPNLSRELNGRDIGNSIPEITGNLNTVVKFTMVIIFALFIILLVSCFIALMRAFIKSTKKSVQLEEINRGETGNGKWLIALMPGLILIGFYYFAEVLRFRGIHIGVVDNILRLIGLM